jgi:hypothetical protein
MDKVIIGISVGFFEIIWVLVVRRLSVDLLIELRRLAPLEHSVVTDNPDLAMPYVTGTANGVGFQAMAADLSRHDPKIRTLPGV